MCSRRARIRPSGFDSNPLEKSTSTIVSTILTTTTKTTDISPTGEMPNRKRVKCWRRPTGPLEPEEVKLAMLETEKESVDEANEVVADGRRDYDAIVESEARQRSILTVTVKRNGGLENSQFFNSLDEKGPFALTKMDSFLLRARRLNRSAAFDMSDSNDGLEIDYKKLYEREKMENLRLRDRIHYLESFIDPGPMCNEQSLQVKLTDSNQNSDAFGKDEMDKRLVQLEEEIKVTEILRADNQRLKEENGALIRVISKLSK